MLLDIVRYVEKLHLWLKRLLAVVTLKLVTIFGLVTSHHLLRKWYHDFVVDVTGVFIAIVASGR